MMSSVRLVLASGSPRRAELLRLAGFTFETLAVDIDEAVRPHEAPAAYVRRLAMEKSAAGQMALTGAGNPGGRGADPAFSEAASDLIVIGADTAVVIDGEILGKPLDDRDAERMLWRLSGARHHVLTGVSLRRHSVERGQVETTAVDVMPLSDAEVLWYVASREGRDKAGAYGIQGLASRFVTRVEGSYSNVVGLPAHTVFSLLRELR